MMKTKSTKSLPKGIGEITNGGVYLQRVRCGKSGCKCSRGEPHFGHYFFTRRNGKLCKQYVRKGELKSFVRIVEKALMERKRYREATKSSNEILREYSQLLGEQDAIVNLLRINSRSRFENEKNED